MRLDVVRDVRGQNLPKPPCAVHGSVTMPSTRESGRSVRLGPAAACVWAAAWREHRVHYTVARTLVCTYGVGAGVSEWASR